MSLETYEGLTLLLRSLQWKLSDLPLSVNRAREGWDIHHSTEVPQQMKRGKACFSHQPI